ncbi:hypothetical protein AGOR_G00208780 [Albula goreensis]|uniref:Protein S100 n=1 Tax=Albula goreensis TaxID=1534307 RepID=A0A8T3CND8_9TELE|nr:hypothetical protein AGOR_G00208780 [Albula goreensis]
MRHSPLSCTPSCIPLIHSAAALHTPIATMSDLQQGMGLVIATFHKYAKKENDTAAPTISKADMKLLLQSELGTALDTGNDPSKVDQIFKDLDANADGTIDFLEYATMVACICMVSNELMQ